MNKNQSTSNAAPAQGKLSKTIFRLLRQYFAWKAMLVFDLSSLNQEKLPIIYANIRV